MSQKYYQKIIINNYRVILNDDVEKEDLDFLNLKNINSNNINIVMYDKYNKKYSLYKFNSKNILNSDSFIKDSDFDTYIIYDYFLRINKNMIEYDYILSNVINSYQYIKKYYKFLSNNNILIILYGSLKSIINFKIIFQKILNIFKKKYVNYNIHIMYIANNDIFEFNNVSLDYSIYINLNDINENNNFMLYYLYIFYSFYTELIKSNFTKIIIINMNYSFINLENILNIDFHKNYYIDDFLKFGIFNEKNFIELSILSNLYHSNDYEHYNFNNHILIYPHFCLNKIENSSSIKLS